MLSLDNVGMKFKNGRKVLNNVTAEFEKGKMYGITGESGAGKTTLLTVIGSLRKPTEGTVYFNGTDIFSFSAAKRAEFRLTTIGFVFQNFMLDPSMTARENVMLPLMLTEKTVDARKRADKLLEAFGLFQIAESFPDSLSGGEKQRTAIARAVANDPEIILTDEPTGNLDSKNAEKVFLLLDSLCQSGKCVIIVTHDTKIYDYTSDVYCIEDKTLRKECTEK